MSTPEERLRRMMGRARGEETVSEAQWEGFAASAHRSLRIQRIVAGGVAALLLVVGGISAAALFDGGSPDESVPPAASQTPGDCLDIDAPNNPEACNYRPQPTGAPTPGATAPPEEVEVQAPPETIGEIWLVDPKTNTLSWGYREMPGPQRVMTVINELLRSPIASDTEAGFTTEIPKGTELLSAEIIDGVAHIDLSSEFGDAGSENPGTMRTREAQVIFTATQIEGVDSVRIFVHGEPYLDQVNPTERADYGDIAPPIVVETPRIGEEVASPLTVSGTANVFEGTVTIRLVIPGEGNDRTVTGAFTTATCGSGCRGEFSKEISYPVIDQSTQATLHVFERSAEDGSRLHEISLPITLLPSE